MSAGSYLCDAEYKRMNNIVKLNAQSSKAAAMEAEKARILEERKVNKVKAAMEKERLVKVFTRIRASGQPIKEYACLSAEVG